MGLGVAAAAARGDDLSRTKDGFSSFLFFLSHTTYEKKKKTTEKLGAALPFE